MNASALSYIGEETFSPSAFLLQHGSRGVSSGLCSLASPEPNRWIREIWSKVWGIQASPNRNHFPAFRALRFIEPDGGFPGSNHNFRLFTATNRGIPRNRRAYGQGDFSIRNWNRPNTTSCYSSIHKEEIQQSECIAVLWWEWGRAMAKAFQLQVKGMIDAPGRARSVVRPRECRQLFFSRCVVPASTSSEWRRRYPNAVFERSVRLQRQPIYRGGIKPSNPTGRTQCHQIAYRNSFTRGPAHRWWSFPRCPEWLSLSGQFGSH